MKRLEAVEGLYRLKIKRQTPRRNIIVLVDTSGSMFSSIFGATGEGSDLKYGVDYAFSLALSILYELLVSGSAVDGYLGFFSDKTSHFEYGGLLKDALMRGGKGDYFSLNDIDASDVAAALNRRNITLKATSGGTDPNPLLQYLLNLAEKELVLHAVFIVTDGYTPAIRLEKRIPLSIHIVPGGARPAVEHPDPSLVHIYQY